MEIILHHPQSPEKQAELRRTASGLHGDIIILILGRLPLPDKAKLRLLDDITDRLNPSSRRRK